MKKISLNEEFHAPDGNVWWFVNEEGRVKMVFVRKSGKTKEFIAPTLGEIKDYFKSKGYTEESAVKFYDYYSEGNWKDSNDKPIKNYKQKAMSVWFKPENKIVEKSKDSSKDDNFLF